MPRPKKNESLSTQKPSGEKRLRGRPSKESTATLASTVQEEIVQQAKKLFRQKGYAGISINDIVASAGITKPTLYYYFKDKESLYAAVLMDLLQHGRDYILTGVASQGSLRENLLALTVGYFKNAPTSLCCLMKDALENVNEGHQQAVVGAMAQQILTPFEKLFEKAYEQGEITDKNAENLAQTYVMMMDAVNLGHHIRTGSNRSEETEAQHMVSLFLDGITASK